MNKYKSKDVVYCIEMHCSPQKGYSLVDWSRHKATELGPNKPGMWISMLL